MYLYNTKLRNLAMNSCKYTDLHKIYTVITNTNIGRVTLINSKFAREPTYRAHPAMLFIYHY